MQGQSPAQPDPFITIGVGLFPPLHHFRHWGAPILLEAAELEFLLFGCSFSYQYGEGVGIYYKLITPKKTQSI